SMGHNTPEYLHLVGEVIRLAAADRNRYVGDPDFVTVPVDRLLSKEYAAERRGLIDLNKTIPVVRSGDLPLAGQKKRENTTHLTVVDAEGNMVSLTQTLGAWFGSGIVAEGTGVLFSNQMRHLHMEPDSPSRMEPGKRPRSNQSPIIALKDGKPFMAIGTPGSDGIWQRMAQVIVNIVDFDMDIQTAITKPRIIFGDYQETGSALKPKLQVENRIPKETMDRLRATGYEIESVVEDEGRVNGVMFNGRTNFLTAGADPRNMVYAIGW
ncbi:MAG TPA: gamma-glutamyltransferase, partial [Vicinamibacterales bacterium]